MSRNEMLYNDMELKQQIDDVNNWIFQNINQDPTLVEEKLQIVDELLNQLSIDYPEGRTRLETNRIILATKSGKHTEVFRLATPLIPRLEIDEDYANLYLAYNSLTLLYWSMGIWDLALEQSVKCLDAARLSERSEAVAGALNSAGLINMEMGNYLEALKYYEQSYLLFSELDKQEQQAYLLHNITHTYFLAGSYQQAINLGYEVLTLMDAHPGAEGKAMTRNTMANIFLRRKQLDQAEAFLLQAQDFAFQTQTTYLQVEVLRSSSDLYLQREQVTLAINHLQRALKLAQQHALKPLEADINLLLSRAYRQMGDFEHALICHETYLTLHEEMLNQETKLRLHTLNMQNRTHELSQELQRERTRQAQQAELANEERQAFEREQQIKDLFLSNASHDLKHPLTSIKLQIYVLRKELADANSLSGEVGTGLNKIEEHIEYMTRLTAQLLDLMQLDSGVSLQLESVALHELLSAVIEDFDPQAQDKQLEVTANLKEMTIEADRFQLRRAFSNLLSNSIKYNREGGQVIISCQIEDDQAVITIKDTGVGITEDNLIHIFDRFYRAPSLLNETVSGSGIGLAIVKAIVEQHQGHIVVSSQLLQGTTFTLTFPFQQRQA